MLTCVTCNQEFERQNNQGPTPSWCPPCKKQRRRDRTNAWHKANPEKVLRHKKRSAPITVLTCVDCGAVFPRSGRFGPRSTCCPDCAPAMLRRRHLRNARRGNLRKYGLTPERFDSMLDAQDGLCAICRTDQWGAFNRPQVDHCHASGRVRGLLCGPCNLAIGCLQDDPAIIRAAAFYVEGSTSID